VSEIKKNKRGKGRKKIEEKGGTHYPYLFGAITRTLKSAEIGRKRREESCSHAVVLFRLGKSRTRQEG